MFKGLIGLLVIVGLIAGWAGSREDDKKPAARAAAAPAPVAAEEEEWTTISRYDMAAGDWPLTVEWVEVWCDGKDGYGAVYARGPEGRVYAVNGTARNWSPEMSDIRPIWRKDPDIPGARINIGPIIDAGLETC